MQFSPDDIIRLYGKRLFQLPETLPAKTEAKAAVVATPKEEPVAPSPDQFLLGGNSIEWKMKPAARLALILDESSFSHKPHTTHLKEAALAAGVSLKEIGFGVFSSNAQSWEIDGMPVAVGLFLGACAGQLTETHTLNAKTIVPAPDLEDALNKPEAQQALLASLQAAWQLAIKS